MAAMGTSSKPTTLMSSGTDRPSVRSPAITPSAIWSLKAITAETPLAMTSGHDDRHGIEGGLAHGHFDHLDPTGGTRLPHRTPALPRGPRSGRPAQVGQVRVPEFRQVRECIGHGRRGPDEDRRVFGHRTVHEHGGDRPQGAKGAVEAPGRHHNEPVDLPGQGLRGPHLLVRVLTRVDQEDLQIALSGGTLNRAHQRGKVRIGDVRNDDGDVAGAPGDEAARGTVGDEAQVPDRRLDPEAGVRCNLVRDVDGARDGGRVHTGACRNVEDGRPLPALHVVRPYSAPSTGLRGIVTSQRRPRLRAHGHWRARHARLPDYERDGAPVIAHLGLGAFARAHLAVYADELLRRGPPALISGVSLRSRRVQDQLEPQDGLFTVAVREPGAAPVLQVVGSLASMESGPAAVVAALSAPSTTLVTLTITENGYGSADEEQAPGTLPSGAPALIAPGTGRAAARRTGGTGLCVARQPARQRDRPAGARPRRGREH